MYTDFDVVSATPFSLSEPRFSRLLKVDPVMCLIGDQHLTDERGFLGLSVSMAEAIWLAKALKRFSIDAYPIHQRYKLARLTQHEAASVAQAYIDEQRVQRPELNLSEISLMNLPWWLSKIAYGFISGSEVMRREGVTPAGMTVCVDKTSGAVLNARQLLNAELATMLRD